MDAPDDRDIKLQRASGDMIKELKAKLPSLLWKCHSQSSKYPHRWAQSAKTDRLITLVSPLARLELTYLCIRIDSANLAFPFFLSEKSWSASRNGLNFSTLTSMNS